MIACNLKYIDPCFELGQNWAPTLYTPVVSLARVNFLC